MPTRSKAKATKPNTDETHADPDQDTRIPGPFPEMLEEYQDNINERFKNLFATEDEDVDVKVQLRRTEPTGTLKCQRTGFSLRIDGPLGWLPPYLDDYETYITDRWGGGTFLAQRRESGKITKNEYVIIASRPPKIFDPESSPASQQSPPTPPAAPEPAMTGGGRVVNIDGADFDLDEDDRKLMRQVIKWNQLQKIINPPPPPAPSPPQELNAIMLEFLMKTATKPQPNPLEAITTLTGLIGTVRELLPEGGGGAAGWADIVNNAITQVGKIVDKSPLLPAGKPGIIHREVKQLTAPDNGAPIENTQQPEIQEDEMRMDPRQLAANAIANINASFRKTKPLPVDQMVEALDFALDLDQETRAKIATFKQALMNMASLEMEPFFEDFPEREAAYHEYFEQVFDEFVRPDREMKTLS